MIHESFNIFIFFSFSSGVDSGRFLFLRNFRLFLLEDAQNFFPVVEENESQRLVYLYSECRVRCYKWFLCVSDKEASRTNVTLRVNPDRSRETFSTFQFPKVEVIFYFRGKRRVISLCCRKLVAKSQNSLMVIYRSFGAKSHYTHLSTNNPR
jgi:hypothetical protein